MSTKDLSSKVKELKELKIMMEELDAEITTIEDEIKAEMTARGTDELLLDMFKISWKAVTSNRFDSKAFNATHEELYSQYTKPTTSKRFLVA